MAAKLSRLHLSYTPESQHLSSCCSFSKRGCTLRRDCESLPGIGTSEVKDIFIVQAPYTLMWSFRADDKQGLLGIVHNVRIEDNQDAHQWNKMHASSFGLSCLPNKSCREDLFPNLTSAAQENSKMRDSLLLVFILVVILSKKSIFDCGFHAHAFCRRHVKSIPL